MVSTIRHAARIWKILSRRRKIQACLLLLSGSFTGALELATISALAVAVSSLFDGQHEEVFIYSKYLSATSLTTTGILIIFVLFITASAIVRLFLTWFIGMISHRIGADVGILIYENNIENYQIEQKNSISDITAAIVKRVDGIIYGLVLPILHISSSVIVILFIISFFANFDLNVLISVVGLLFFVYITIYVGVRVIVKRDGSSLAHLSSKVLSFIFNSLRGRDDIVLHKVTDNFVMNFSLLFKRYQNTVARVQFFAMAPRILVEFLGIIGITAMTAQLILSGKQNGDTIQIIASIVFAMQRMLPFFQQIYSSYVNIASNIENVNQALNIAYKTKDNFRQASAYKYLNSHEATELKLVNISYSLCDKNKTRKIVSDINLTLKVGEVVGIHGPSGGGKSTLGRIICGLAIPTQGSVELVSNSPASCGPETLINNSALVSQHYYIAEGSLAENIAFGKELNEIDSPSLDSAINLSLVSRIFDGDLDTPYNFRLQEMGVNLSGGQRQRIAIARAFYKKKAYIWVLDEATSALDEETKKLVLDNLLSQKNEKIIVIISHDNQVLNSCDRLVEMRNGEIVMDMK